LAADLDRNPSKLNLSLVVRLSPLSRDQNRIQDLAEVRSSSNLSRCDAQVTRPYRIDIGPDRIAIEGTQRASLGREQSCTKPCLDTSPAEHCLWRPGRTINCFLASNSGRARRVTRRRFPEHGHVANSRAFLSIRRHAEASKNTGDDDETIRDSQRFLGRQRGVLFGKQDCER